MGLDTGLIIFTSLIGVTVIVTIIAAVNIFTNRADKEKNHQDIL
jgi:hypothetical protein